MCDVGDFEPCEVWSETLRRARKPHKCSSCGGLIVPGDKYLVHFSIYQRDCTWENLCLLCDEARTVFFNHHDSGCCVPSHLSDFVESCISDGDEESDRLWKPMLEAMEARRTAAAGAT